MMKLIGAVLGVVGTMIWLFLAEKATEAPDGTTGEIIFDLTWAVTIGFLTIASLQ